MKEPAAQRERCACGKIKFRTRKEAEGCARFMLLREDDHVSPYWCRSGQAFHVGHSVMPKAPRLKERQHRKKRKSEQPRQDGRPLL
jgi:hypothetical protein